MSMGKFDKYKGLFAEQGGFDIPASYGLGVAYTALPAGCSRSTGLHRLRRRPSIANQALTGAPLGATTTRLRLAVRQRLQGRRRVSAQPAWTLRPVQLLGQPIDSANVTFTSSRRARAASPDAGFSYNMPDKSSITVAFMHAFENSVSGSSLFNSFLHRRRWHEKISIGRTASASPGASSSSSRLRQAKRPPLRGLFFVCAAWRRTRRLSRMMRGRRCANRRSSTPCRARPRTGTRRTPRSTSPCRCGQGREGQLSLTGGRDPGFDSGVSSA